MGHFRFFFTYLESQLLKKRETINSFVENIFFKSGPLSGLCPPGKETGNHKSCPTSEKWRKTYTFIPSGKHTKI